MNPFTGRVALQQRVLPEYRTAFFDQLAARCEDGLSVYAGEPRASEAIRISRSLSHARFQPARNAHFLSGLFYLCFQPGITRWLANWDPDVLILEANARYPSSRRAIGWMRRRGRPVIGWGLGAPGSSPLRDAFLRRFDALIAYSTQGAVEYRAIGIPSERVFVAPNAATGPPAPLQARRPAADRQMRVLFVGRLQQRKRVELLLQACQRLEAEPELWVVGDGPDRQRLERQAQHTYPQAAFLGARNGKALADTFREADIFVLPGTGGLAVQQAMAHGLPVIVAEADGSQRDLVSADNGWLVPAGDLGALTETLQQALQDPTRLREMGAASHRIVTERVNIEVMAQVFIQAIRSVREA